MPYTEYTSQCCDIIEKYAQTEGDKILAWLVRLQRLNEETSELRRARRGHSQSEYQIGMMLRGMETQLDDWERRMDPKVAAKRTFGSCQAPIYLLPHSLFLALFPSY